MIVAGRSAGSDSVIEVENPFDGSVVDTVPSATPDQIEDALAGAEVGASRMEKLTRFERASILSRAAAIIESESEGLARCLAEEVGKTVREARGEVARAVETFTLSAEEARRLAGEVVPFDGAPTGGGRFGFYLRVPVGIVVAITPFNFPLNLSAHKIAPAIAAGNAVILKPASATPLSGLALGRILLESGLPGEAISVVTGSGGTIGRQLVADRRPRMVTFTGSADVGKAIMRDAGLKKMAMELGSNSAVVVTEHCDLEAVAKRVTVGAFALAGQVCISVQRVLAQNTVADELLRLMADATSSMKVGDQLLEETDMGPMIDEREAGRAQAWCDEARGMGAAVVTGGTRAGTLFEPTIFEGVPDAAGVWKDEVFAPVVSVNRYRLLDEAIECVNRSRYGLQAGIYTDRLEDALRASHEIRCGGVIVNDVPTFRVDLMPYGGEKDSGIGREGPKFAIEEMSEIRVVAFRRS